MWFKPSCDFQSLPKPALVKTVLKTRIKPPLFSMSYSFHRIPVPEGEFAPQIPTAELGTSTVALISLLNPWSCWTGVVQCSLYERNVGHKLLPLALGRWWGLCSQGPACYWCLLYKENVNCRFHSFIISYSITWQIKAWSAGETHDFQHHWLNTGQSFRFGCLKCR